MQNILIVLLCVFIGYLIGSVSWSYILTKLIWGYDIREKGSGNAGASNVTINQGWKFGVLVFLLDFLKTFIVVKLINYILGVENIDKIGQFHLSIAAGLASIIGHTYPFWLNFRGGKGTASAIGLAFGLSIMIGIIGFLTIALVTVLTRYVSLGGIALWLSLVVSTYAYYSNIYISLAIFIFMLLSIYKHKENIVRIMNGEEVGIKRKYGGEDRKAKKYNLIVKLLNT